MIKVRHDTAKEILSVELFPLWRENLKAELLLAQTEFIFGGFNDAKQHLTRVQTLLEKVEWLQENEQMALRDDVENLLQLFVELQPVDFEPTLAKLQQMVESD